jgi:TonB family protein
LPGFTVGGASPILYVGVAARDRQVFLCWKQPFADLLGTARDVARTRTDSCAVEWQAGGDPIVHETWWVDRARGMAVCPDGASWYGRTWGKGTWNLRCPALRLDPAGGGYVPSTLDYALDYEASLHEQAAKPSDAPSESIYAEELPEAIGRVPPEYPDDARVRNVEGMVLVKALVDTTGAVSRTLVVASIPLLDVAAVTAVRQWRFKPALSNGRPVKVWVAIPVSFKLR